MRKAKRSKPKKRNKFFKDNSQNESPEAEGLDAQKKTKEQREEKPIPVVPSQSVIPIKDIYRGMIITDDDRYIKIVEVLPTNFTLKSVEEQDNIIHLFASWLRIAPSNIQFKVITRRADSTNIIRNIMKAAEVEEQPKCRELTKDHIRFIQELSGQEALARRFFIIFEYENTGTRKKTIDDIADDIAEAVRKIRSGVGACGSEIVIPKDDDYFQAEALYQFYNRKSSAKESLAERVIRVTEDTMKVKGLTKGVDPYPTVPIVDYLAPRGLDFTHKNFVICDGQYLSFFFIPRDGYPSAVIGGWFTTLVEAGDGVDVDIIARKQDRGKVKDKVALKLKLTRIKASNRSDTDTDFESIAEAISAAQYIKQSISNGEDFYNMYTFVTIAADTYDELLRRKESISDYLYSRDITIKEIVFRTEDAFQITAPLLQEKKELCEFAQRNVMTYGLASMFPFTSCEICDENGIVLGVNRRYSSVVNMDIFNTKKYKNANITVTGTTGAGKTYCTLLMALRFRYQGIQTFIITPDKAHEMQRVCTHIGGSYISISPGAKSCINIMEIRPVVSPISEYLDEQDSFEQKSWLTQKTSQMLTFFHILVPDLTNEEEQLVDEAIIKTYNEFGITHDNASIYIAGTKKVKPMPIIGDLYNTLQKNEYTQRVAHILGRFVTGSASSFNHQTNVDLENKFIVFDLEDLQGTMKAVGMFIVMDFLWTRIKQNRTERKAVIIDEGWQLIGASSDSRAADFVYRIFKIIRGYGGSAIFATQDISDLFAFQDGKYGKAIISNSKTKIILGLEAQEAKAMQDVLQLTKNEVRSIVNFNRGEGLICANNNKVPVFIRASRLEDELITTDPAQIAAIVKRKKAERIMREHEEEQTEREDKKVNLMDSSINETATPLDKIVTDDSHVDYEMSEPAEKKIPRASTPAAPKNEEQLAYEAKMSSLAMDQMAEGAVVKNPDGTIDNFENQTILVNPTYQDDSDEASVFVEMSNEIQEQPNPKTENNPPKSSPANKPPANELYNDTLNSNGNEDDIYEHHPPAQF